MELLKNLITEEGCSRERPMMSSHFPLYSPSWPPRIISFPRKSHFDRSSHEKPRTVAIAKILRKSCHFTNTLIATHSNPFCAIVAIQIFPFNFLTEAQDQHAFQEFNHFVDIHGFYRCPWMRNKCDCTEHDNYTFDEHNSVDDDGGGGDDDEKWRNGCFVVTGKWFCFEYVTSNGRFG